MKREGGWLRIFAARLRAAWAVLPVDHVHWGIFCVFAVICWGWRALFLILRHGGSGRYLLLGWELLCIGLLPLCGLIALAAAYSFKRRVGWRICLVVLIGALVAGNVAKIMRPSQEKRFLKELGSVLRTSVPNDDFLLYSASEFQRLEYYSGMKNSRSLKTSDGPYVLDMFREAFLSHPVLFVMLKNTDGSEKLLDTLRRNFITRELKHVSDLEAHRYRLFKITLRSVPVTTPIRLMLPPRLVLVAGKRYYFRRSFLVPEVGPKDGILTGKGIRRTQKDEENIEFYFRRSGEFQIRVILQRPNGDYLAVQTVDVTVIDPATAEVESAKPDVLGITDVTNWETWSECREKLASKPMFCLITADPNLERAIAADLAENKSEYGKSVIVFAGSLWRKDSIETLFKAWRRSIAPAH